jgi:hypothetical protein
MELWKGQHASAQVDGKITDNPQYVQGNFQPKEAGNIFSRFLRYLCESQISIAKRVVVFCGVHAQDSFDPRILLDH